MSVLLIFQKWGFSFKSHCRHSSFLSLSWEAGNCMLAHFFLLFLQVLTRADSSSSDNGSLHFYLTHMSDIATSADRKPQKHNKGRLTQTFCIIQIPPTCWVNNIKSHKHTLRQGWWWCALVCVPHFHTSCRWGFWVQHPPGWWLQRPPTFSQQLLPLRIPAPSGWRVWANYSVLWASSASAPSLCWLITVGWWDLSM